MAKLNDMSTWTERLDHPACARWPIARAAFSWSRIPTSVRDRHSFRLKACGHEASKKGEEKEPPHSRFDRHQSFVHSAVTLTGTGPGLYSLSVVCGTLGLSRVSVPSGASRAVFPASRGFIHAAFCRCPPDSVFYNAVAFGFSCHVFGRRALVLLDSSLFELGGILSGLPLFWISQAARRYEALGKFGGLL
jgi:hypothetical protein